MNLKIKSICDRIMASRPPDVVIGGADHPYLLRWWVWKRNKWLNLYLHRVLRSDDDRALHDHPWINMSYIVEGEYNEVTPQGRTNRKQGTFKFRLPTALHRLELVSHLVEWKAFIRDNQVGTAMLSEEKPCTTLFLTGPRVRTWGFQCPKGWVKWFEFTKKDSGGSYIAEGCGDIDPALLNQDAAKSGWWPKAPDGVSEPSKGQTPRDTATRAGAVNRS